MKSRGLRFGKFIKIFMDKSFEQFNKQDIDQKESKRPPEGEGVNLSPELLPYRDEMKNWVESHMDDIGVFLEYRNTKFKLIYGDGFYHQPGTDTISVDVAHYKKYKDKGLGVEQSVFFLTFHEFAHLKTMLELDEAGKHNLREQFNYEGKKVIRSKENPAKFASLQPTYRKFYNILEDAIVNHLVFNTRHFSGASGEGGKKSRTEIINLYTDQFFSIFKKVELGKGEYIVNPDPSAAQKEPIVRVGEGKGDLIVMKKEDYERGFDWNEAEPELGRSGQFLTFFMKNQMIGLKASEIYDKDKNPGGKHKLNEDAAIALTRSLGEAYKILLEKVIEKYKNDPGKLKRYVEFMKEVIKIRSYKEKGGEIVEGKSDLQENVINPKAVSNDMLEVNVALAGLMYKEKIKRIGAEMGISSILSYSFLDLFNQFKALKKSRQYSWTFPLKYNLAERSKIARKALEPIFSLLCILDDSFDVKVMEESPEGEGKGSEGESPSSPEKPEWRKGEKVINDQEGSPNKGKKGIISNVDYAPDGKILSVDVEYYEEK